MRAKQESLFDYFDMSTAKRRYGRTKHGGANTRGKRKQERPLSTKKWIHLVLKSEKAEGRLSFLAPKNQEFVESTIRRNAKDSGVKIAELVNVGNHLHLKIRITSRRSFQHFLRVVTALIAKKLTGAKRGQPFGRFWQGLAFTRVLLTSLEELNLRGYLEANRREVRSPKAREDFLRKFNAWVYGKEAPA